ncbi:endo-beta-1,4-glucanase [Penaeus vannamei]|uniref:cellulase n=1 Tax=Penaeus vannamei TaxID=6689 RepID=A0A3R7MDC4_PENVA|nr:endo-beta-1,4-glucanase [Penaeus vannamei]
MAFTATVLAWGLVDFPAGHQTAGQTEYARAAVKWATDYFLKAHTSYFELYGQVGDGYADHAYWGRPEEMTMARPSMKIDNDHPGTELAGETAAALAAASIAFKDSDPTYSSQMLEVAKELYDFADQRRENYDVSIPGAADFYKSWSGYGDELCWAALWLARATGDSSYMTKARQHWDEFGISNGADGFNWDDKKGGVYALYALMDSDPTFSGALAGFVEHIRNDKPYTPGGLVFLDPMKIITIIHIILHILAYLFRLPPFPSSYPTLPPPSPFLLLFHLLPLFFHLLSHCLLSHFLYLFHFHLIFFHFLLFLHHFPHFLHLFFLHLILFFLFTFYSSSTTFPSFFTSFFPLFTFFLHILSPPSLSPASFILPYSPLSLYLFPTFFSVSSFISSFSTSSSPSFIFSLFFVFLYLSLYFFHPLLFLLLLK